jgi:predicted DNA binding protein
MSTILKASVPADQFALAATFETIPSAEFDAVRLVTHGSDRVVPLLWVMNADPAAAYEAMDEDPTTADVQLVTHRNHDSLFHLHWTARIQFVTHVLVEENGAILRAHGTDDTWTFRILFPDRDAVSSTYDACEEFDIDIERICHLDDAPSLGGSHLTEEQFVTIRAALNEGYYTVPRGAKLEELAAELGVSHQALSERLRRGHRTLIEAIVTR